MAIIGHLGKVLSVANLLLCLRKQPLRQQATHHFMNIPMLAVVREAGIDPNTFYRHYGTLDKLYEIFLDQYNFWLNETPNLSDVCLLGDKKFYAESLPPRPKLPGIPDCHYPN